MTFLKRVRLMDMKMIQRERMVSFAGTASSIGLWNAHGKAIQKQGSTFGTDIAPLCEFTSCLQS